ncbi:MAG: DUF523 domain-containing protein [Erysipelotrichaceae bacterium]|nr:DUF523 domain-containing protein [Erysipelotrichaceae bacterium]
MKIGISACLTGEKVRYDGTDKKSEELLETLKGHELVKICPEMAAGFSVPHDPIEIRKEQVLSLSGKNVTEKLYKGARECLEMIMECDFVILKEKSPSCGLHKIYDGSFSGKLIEGNGIFARLCQEHKILVYSETDIEEIRRKTAGK